MMDSGLAYLNTVKDAFKDEREKYDKFLELMKNFTAERFNLVRGIKEVKELFKGHRDLILGFNVFLPKEYKIKLPLEDEQPPQKKPDTFVEAKKLLCKIKTRFQGDDHVYKTFLAVLKMHRDGNKTPTSAYKEITALLQDHADLLNELPCLSHNTPRTASIHFASPEKSLFHERSYAVQQMSVPKRKRTKTSHDDHDHSVDPRLERDWSVVNYSKEKITQQKLQSSATDFQGKYPDLVKGFNERVIQCEKMNESSWDEEHVQKRLKVEDWDRDRHHDSDDRVKETNIECQKRDKSSAVDNKNVSGPKLSLDASKKKYSAKSEELDLSTCEQCTPSYYLLPKEFQIPSSSGRTKLDAEVLNDQWKCIGSSIKDYSSKHMRKNPYEMILFECEDDRFELDMLLETAKSTNKRVEELIEKINANIIGRENPINIEKHLTARNLRCIEHVYGEHGLDVMDAIRNNAYRVLPVILTRLKQKEEEWERCRADFNKLWAETYAENYQKSLDHRSFY